MRIERVGEDIFLAKQNRMLLLRSQDNLLIVFGFSSI